jgi:NAD+ synthase (glutamine-hydrolysing)
VRSLRIGLAQINPTVGDFEGNTDKVLSYIADARAQGVDVVAFPELAVCGYPPEDMLFKPRFVDENLKCVSRIAADSNGITVIVGFADAKVDLYNAAAILHDGRLVDVYHKVYLPNYGVFDEDRYFQSGSRAPVYVISGVGVGANICEDIWYEAGPTTYQAYRGAEVIVNISASPYYVGRRRFRERMLATRASDNVAILAYVNLVGGQDELVFDGNSVIFDPRGELIARGRQFEEGLVIADLDVEGVFRSRLYDPRWRKASLALGDRGSPSDKVLVSEAKRVESRPPIVRLEPWIEDPPGEVYQALVLGTRDYLLKNRIAGVVVGLSGGIDSSLVAAIAVDALGAPNVVGVSMPSRYSSGSSVSDAEAVARNLDIRLISIPIDGAFTAYEGMLAEAFAGTEPNVAEENLQARIRGNVLMALSNKFGWLVLATGNKSEMATGYTTLYGDMAGGFAVIKDVPKTMVYELARYRNAVAGTPLIPESVLQKPPSAELRPGQKDSDSLPPYDLLDPVLKAYVEEDKSLEQIVALGMDAEVARRAARLVDRSEYKRRQAPPGVKITLRAFGRDRRLPITNRFQEW